MDFAGCINNEIALCHFALVDSHKGQLAEGSVLQFEGKGHERFF